jgi:hypothetical protein
MSYDSGDYKRFARKYPDVHANEQRQIYDAELANRFTFHQASGAQAANYEVIRAAGLTMARELLAYCPPSHELQKAIDAIDQAVMWANAAIARNPE